MDVHSEEKQPFKIFQSTCGTVRSQNVSENCTKDWWDTVVVYGREGGGDC